MDEDGVVCGMVSTPVRSAMPDLAAHANRGPFKFGDIWVTGLELAVCSLVPDFCKPLEEDRLTSDRQRFHTSC